jgi:hypothetical protein
MNASLRMLKDIAGPIRELSVICVQKGVNNPAMLEGLVDRAHSFNKEFLVLLPFLPFTA